VSNPTAETRHLDESDLLHLVDGDLPPMERDVYLLHVAQCEACAEQLQTLRRRTSNLSALLAEVELPDDFVYPRMPERPATVHPLLPQRGGWMRSGWARAAAVVLLVALPFAGVAPLRAWAMDRLGAAWSEVRGLFGGDSDAPAPTPQPAPAPAAPAAPAETAGSTLFFTPSGARFALTIGSAQAGGSLTIGRAEGSEGTVEVTGGTSETPVVSESSVRIENEAASTASYRVLLPPSVRTLTVRIGSASAVTLDAAVLAAGRTMDLSAP
jgi:hypothetical protein